MTINSEDTHDEYLRSLYDDGSGGFVDDATRVSRITSDMEQLGILYDDEGDIPGTSTVRESGTFTDPWAMAEYLQAGGLAATDGNSDYVPIGFVYMYYYFDDLLQDWAYRVWIDEDTE